MTIHKENDFNFKLDKLKVLYKQANEENKIRMHE